MLYLLYSQYDINLFQYITVRAGIAFFLALISTLFLMPRFIRWAQRSATHQPINEYVPAHKEKAKTPTKKTAAKKATATTRKAKAKKEGGK